MLDTIDIIIANLNTRLKNIDGTGVFTHNLGRSVLYGEDEVPDGSQCPQINYWFGSEDFSEQFSDKDEYNARNAILTVEGYTPLGSKKLATVAKEVKADIEHAVLFTGGDLDNTLNGACYHINFLSADPFLLTNNTDIGGCIVTFEVIYMPASTV